MELSKLAQDLTGTLAPCLPFLTDVGKDLAKDAIAKVGHETWELAKSLWAKLRDKLRARPGAIEKIQDVAAKPESPLAQTALAYEVLKVVEADASLARELAQLLANAPPGATAVGDRSVAIGGSANNAVIIPGDGNVVNSPSRPTRGR